MKKNKKKVIIVGVCVIAVWLIVGIVDFALVHSFQRPVFCVCTESMQDGGSGKYAGLGYSFNIEGNFMPDTETPATEEEKPKVTSYRGYIFGKEVSRGFWDEMLVAPYKNIITYPVNVNKPPELVVVCGEEQITALKGSYSWKYQNGDGTCTAIEADGAHPLDCKEIMPNLSLAYSPKSSIDVLKAHFQFAIEPDEVEVWFWSEDCWNLPSEKRQKLEVQAVEADLVDGSFSIDYSAKLFESNNIYVVSAKWNSSEEYGGTACYWFYTVMGNYELVPVGK